MQLYEEGDLSTRCVSVAVHNCHYMSDAEIRRYKQRHDDATVQALKSTIASAGALPFDQLRHACREIGQPIDEYPDILAGYVLAMDAHFAPFLREHAGIGLQALDFTSTFSAFEEELSKAGIPLEALDMHMSREERLFAAKKRYLSSSAQVEEK